MMIVGESGIGKSTVINNLFNAELYPKKQSVPLTEDSPTEVQLKAINGGNTN